MLWGYGEQPIHLMNAADRKKTPTLKDYFIDTGMSQKELEVHFRWKHYNKRKNNDRDGDCINCKSLDNRVSVYILIEMLKSYKETIKQYLCGVYCSGRNRNPGANVSSMDINPDFGFHSILP